MKTVTISRVDLLTKLKENRKTHIQDVKEGLTKRKLKVSIFLKDLIAKNDSGDGNFDVTISNHFPKINSYEESYDRIITMLEMSVDENITLTAQEFDNYVLDNWSSTGILKSSLGAAGLAKYQ